MSPGRLKSSGDEVSSPPNTPETDRSLDVIRQKDESIDKYDANTKSGGDLESNRPVEQQVTQTRRSDTLERGNEPMRSNKKRGNINDLVSRSQELGENVKNVRDKEEKSRFSFSRGNRTEEIQSINKKLKSDCTIGYLPVGVINLTKEEIVLPKGFSLGIAVEIEIEDFANLERNETLTS
jgi:hypothetical protein